MSLPGLGLLCLLAPAVCAQSAFINYYSSFRTAAWGEHRFIPQPFRLPWNLAFPFIYLLIPMHTCRLALHWEDGARKWIQLDAHPPLFFPQSPTLRRRFSQRPSPWLPGRGQSCRAHGQSLASGVKVSCGRLHICSHPSSTSSPGTGRRLSVGHFSLQLMHISSW